MKVANPGLDKDGPGGIDAVHPVSPLDPAPPVTLGYYDFDTGPSCIDEGWFGVDRTAQAGDYWHVDDFVGLGGGSFGLLSPLNGSRSLWCGIRPGAGVPECSYIAAPGYGNDWDQRWHTIDCVSLDANAAVSMLLSHDTFNANDYIAVGYSPCYMWDQFVEITRYWGRQSATPVSVPLPSEAQTGGPINVMVRVVTDPAGSDYDGVVGGVAVDTDGAVIIDDLVVEDVTGTVVPLETFDTTPLGSTSTTDWVAGAPWGYQDFAGLFNALFYVQEDTYYRDLTCVWAFWNGTLSTYACGGFPSQPTVPYQNDRGQYIHNEIWSPWLTFVGDPEQTTHLEFDVYEDNELDALTFYYWMVREKVSDCPGPWRSDGFAYYTPPDQATWRTGSTRFSANLTPFLSSPDEIQVALGVIDMCRWWCGVYGTGSCHSHAPCFDNIEVLRKNTHGWVVNDADLFQDAFPADETTTGTVRCDAPSGDEMQAYVNAPGVGIAAHSSGPGPAVYLYVRNLAGKQGAIVSGGPAWPWVPAMSTPEWTVLQMDSAGSDTSGVVISLYTVDVNDALYQAGDVVEFFFSARDNNGATSYWSQFTGTTLDISDVQSHPMEMTGLPAGGDILYVDHYSGYGAEPYFEKTFDALGVNADRFDRRSPTSHYNNTFGDQAYSVNQVLPYDAILVDTGRLFDDILHDSDYSLLKTYLDGSIIYCDTVMQCNNAAGLYMCGDNIAEAMLLDPASAQLRNTYIEFGLQYNDHTSVGHYNSPLVVGVPSGCFNEISGPDSLVAYGGAPIVNRFDILEPLGTASTEMHYEGNPAQAAIIGQSTTTVNGSVASVMVSGFSFHTIRDERPTDVVERETHMYHILNCLLGGATQPIATDDTPHVNSLAQNYPNPFNPSTTISFSVRESGPVRLVVYDVSGARVRTLLDEETSAGEHFVTWDGTNNAGHSVASGVYFYRLQAAGFTETRKMVVMK
jgi:hypothetical protein